MSITMRPPTQTRKGMTLIEILFAFAIIGAIITLSYASALRSWRTTLSANQRTQGQYIAQDALEQVRAYRDLNDTTAGLPQGWMKWAAGPSTGDGGEIGGFLQAIGLYSGISPNVSKEFVVRVCSTPNNPGVCYWKVVAPDSVTPIGESTAFKVSIVATGFDCTDPTAPCDFSAPDNVGSLTLVATVRFRDANGIDSNVVASTILARSEK